MGSLNSLAGLNRRALSPNAFGGGGAAASSKRMGHQNKQGGGGGGGDDVDESNCVNSNNFVVRERLFSFRAKMVEPVGECTTMAVAERTVKSLCRPGQW